MCVPDKNSQARVNYSGALLSILRAVAFCTRVFVKFKSSGTVHISHFVVLIAMVYKREVVSCFLYQTSYTVLLQ